MAIKRNENMTAAPVAENNMNGAPPAKKAKENKQQAAPTEKAPAPEKKNEKPEKAEPAAEGGEGSQAEDPEVAAAFDEFVQLQEQFNLMSNAVKSMSAMLKNLNKKYTKLYKASQKKQKRGQGTGGVKRSSNGFAKPTKLSPALCKFLGVPEGQEMGRVDVTKGLTKYIKENNLVDAEDKRIIKPDAKLKGILSAKDGDEVTYFNLQKYIKHHFVKDEPASEAAK